MDRAQCCNVVLIWAQSQWAGLVSQIMFSRLPYVHSLSITVYPALRVTDQAVFQLSWADGRGHPGQVGSLLQGHKRQTNRTLTLSPEDNLESPIRPQEQEPNPWTYCCEPTLLTTTAPPCFHPTCIIQSKSFSLAQFLSLQIRILSCSSAILTGDKIPVFFIHPVSPLHLICYQMLPWVLIKDVHSKCLQTEGGTETKSEAKASDDEATCSSNSVRTNRGKSSSYSCEPQSVSVPKNKWSCRRNIVNFILWSASIDILRRFECFF